MTAVCLGEFPYEARVPGAGVEVITDDNLWEIISRLEVPGIESFFIADPSKLVTKWAVEVTNRYTYCSEFNTPAYAGAYDDQPNFWVKAVGVIQQARSQASEWRRQHGN
jgi:hypothetical protein